MRITIVGAGAIGGTVGAYLARSGAAVEMVDKDAAHVTAMAEQGLTIQGFDETFTVGIEAITPEKLLEIGRGHGLPMPLTGRLVTMIHELEDGTRQRTVANIDELELVRRAGAAAGTHE